MRIGVCHFIGDIYAQNTSRAYAGRNRQPCSHRSVDENDWRVTCRQTVGDQHDDTPQRAEEETRFACHRSRGGRRAAELGWGCIVFCASDVTGRSVTCNGVICSDAVGRFHQRLYSGGRRIQAVGHRKVCASDRSTPHRGLIRRWVSLCYRNGSRSAHSETGDTVRHQTGNRGHTARVSARRYKGLAGHAVSHSWRSAAVYRIQSTGRKTHAVAAPPPPAIAGGGL